MEPREAASSGGSLGLAQDRQGRTIARSPRRQVMPEYGGSKLQLLIAVLVLGAIGLTAFRIIPVYVRSYEFEDAIRTQAKFAGVNRSSPAEVKQALYRKATELNLPIDRKQIRVTSASQGVRIAVQYTVPVDLIVYTADIPFDFQADTLSVY